MMGANDVEAAQIDCVYEHGILLRFLIPGFLLLPASWQLK